MDCLTVMYDADYVGIIQIENVKWFNNYVMWFKVIKKQLFELTLVFIEMVVMAI